MTFLEKFELIKKSVPVPATNVRSSIDSEYTDFVDHNKNCYFCFNTLELSDSMYTTLAIGNKIVDCYQMTDCEKCYQSLDCNRCHNSTYITQSNDSTDCHFSIYLNSCSDCFGCVALTHKKYCIYNRQYTKEEYFKGIAELNKEKPEKILKQMFDLKQTIPHPASQQLNNENSPYGDFIYNSKNCYWGFHAFDSIDSGYIFASGYFNDCWDTLFTYGDPVLKTTCSRCYQMSDATACYDSAFLSICQNCTNCYYSSYLTNCSDCFGCVGLTNKKYCILNNQLTKDQYEKAIKQIKKELGWRV